MIHPSIPFILLALAAPAAAALSDAPAPDMDGVQFAQFSIHQRIIVRVPRMVPRPTGPTSRAQVAPLAWKERKGPKCVAVGDIAGAIIGPPGSVDMLMDNGTRLRARLDGDCKPLDYYPGFYLKPAADGLICRDRDVIRMRSGASCEIDDFKSLEIKR